MQKKKGGGGGEIHNDFILLQKSISNWCALFSDSV